MRGSFPGVILEEGAAVAGFCTHCLLSCPLTPELGPEGNVAFATEPHLNEGFTSSCESEVLVFMTSLCPMQLICIHSGLRPLLTHSLGVSPVHHTLELQVKVLEAIPLRCNYQERFFSVGG